MEKQTVNVGDIFYYSWGYDQTNIDFYQVIELNGKTQATLKELEQSSQPVDWCREIVRPVKDSFADSKPIKKSIKEYEGKPIFKMEYGSLRPLTPGEGKHQTSYA